MFYPQIISAKYNFWLHVWSLAFLHRKLDIHSTEGTQFLDWVSGAWIDEHHSQ